jgi:hypothetical protein
MYSMENRQDRVQEKLDSLLVNLGRYTVDGYRFIKVRKGRKMSAREA